MILSGPSATNAETHNVSTLTNGGFLVAFGMNILVQSRTATMDARSIHNIVRSTCMERVYIKDLIPITYPCSDH
jgi:hypothetical protein